MDMNFFRKKVAIGWAIVGPLIAFVLGPGFFWEWRRMPLVNLELGRGLAELHQKKMVALEDVLRPEMVKAPADSPVWKAKMDYLNSIERSLADLENRQAVIYGRPMHAPTIRVE
jgi:hypothetical protein